MKRLFLTYLLVSLVTGCSDPTPPQVKGGGVGIGNGRNESSITEYQSPLGYRIQYNSALRRISKNNGVSVTLDNAHLLTPGDRLSSINFLVSESTPGMVLDDLERDLKTRYPGVDFERVQLPGATGFKREYVEGDKMRKWYFLLTTTLALITVDAQTYAEARGTELVAPVAETLFAEFYFRERPLYDDSDAVKGYVFLETYEANRIKLKSGRSPEVDLILMPDKTFVMNYHEGDAYHGGISFPDDVKLKRRGNWRTENDRIVLDGVGIGKKTKTMAVVGFPGVDKEINAFELTFTKDIQGEGLVGKAMILVLVRSNHDPRKD